MLKKFRISSNNEILWQDGYSDQEINDILIGRYSSNQTMIEVKSKASSHTQKPQIERHQIADDENCPICYEPVKETEALTFCKRQCGTNFHAKCAEIWAEQQQYAGKSQITCPICRADWGQNALNEIKKDEREYVEKRKVHKVMCRQCKISPIVGSIFQCAICSKVLLCQKCYLYFHHPEHHTFFVRSRNDEEWQTVSRKGNLTKMEFYYSCFPWEDEDGAKSGGLRIVGSNLEKEKIKCDFCQEIDPLWNQIRKLKCGHKFDQKCLPKLIELKFICPFDSVPSLDGLMATLSKEERSKLLFKRASSLQSQKTENPKSQFHLLKPPKLPTGKKQSTQLPQLQIGSENGKTKQGLPVLSINSKRFNENSYKQKNIKLGRAMFMVRQKEPPQQEMGNLLQIQAIRSKEVKSAKEGNSYQGDLYDNQLEDEYESEFS